MHDLYFAPKYEEFQSRTIWSLSIAFTSAFKELDPIPQFKATAKPVLIVSSLINRYYVLDLLPELSVIALLNRRGFDVYVLDWKSPGPDGPALGFTDYVDGVIPAAATSVACRASGVSPTI